MTVSPAPRSAMCSEPNVTVTCLQIHRTSPSDRNPKGLGPRRHDDRLSSTSGDNDVAVTPSSHAQRTSTMSSGAVGDADDRRQRGKGGVVKRMSDAEKGGTGVELAPDVNGLERLWKVPASGGSASVEDCTKLVLQMSRELALLHGLSRGVGGDTDSERLREELRLSRHRATALAHQIGTSLGPLFKSKSALKKDEISEVERMYRIYSGCLEYFVYLLHKMRSLIAIFRINHETCFFIQTGITDPVGFVPHKGTSGLSREGSGAGVGSSNSPPQPQEDLTRMSGDIKAMQQLLYIVNSACDIQPWDVEEEKQDRRKARKSSTDPHHRSEARRSCQVAPAMQVEGRPLQMRKRESVKLTSLPHDNARAGACSSFWRVLCGCLKTERENRIDRPLIVISDEN